MRFRLALLLSFSMGATSAFGGEASFGGNDRPYKAERMAVPEPVQAPVAPPPPPKAKPIVAAPPVAVAPPAPVDKPVTPPPPAPPVVENTGAPTPHFPKLRNEDKCPFPREHKTSSDFKVVVDQAQKKMFVTSPDFPNGLTVPITAGEGRKVPHPSTLVFPYYACTPTVKNKIVTGFKSHEFSQDPKVCSADDIRYRTTMHKGASYASRTFTNEDGSGAIMPNALFVDDGGFFIHEAMEKYYNKLGKSNGSGGCIRVPGWRSAPELMGLTPDKTAMTTRTANVPVVNKAGKITSYRKELQLQFSDTLYKQMDKYGAMEINVLPAPPQMIKDDYGRNVDVCQLSKDERENYAIAHTLGPNYTSKDAARMKRIQKQVTVNGVPKLVAGGEIFELISEGMNSADGSTPAIQTGTEGPSNPIFDFFFGGARRQQRQSWQNPAR